MAGPLSSEEIEDVVSSVRRLVSNEQRPRTLSRDLNADRLILTPALRVVSESSPLAPLMLQIPVSDHAVKRSTEVPDLPEVTSAGPDFDPVITVEAAWESELWVEPEEIPLAEIALGAEEAEVLPAATEDAVVVVLASDPEELPEPWAEAENEWVEDDPIPFVPLRRRAENLAARLAAGVVKDAAQTEIDPDTPAETDAGSTAGPYVEDEDTTVDADPVMTEMSAQQRMPTEIIDADGVPLAVLDEAALQEIVRLMIRDELQGALGERITRSVRKLVRAEINRALVSRDLD